MQAPPKAWESVGIAGASPNQAVQDSVALAAQTQALRAPPTLQTVTSGLALTEPIVVYPSDLG